MFFSPAHIQVAVGRTRGMSRFIQCIYVRIYRYKGCLELKIVLNNNEEDVIWYVDNVVNNISYGTHFLIS